MGNMATEDILEALRQIAREKSVDQSVLIETLRQGVLTAAKKRYATAEDVEVTFDEGSGQIKVLVLKKVVLVAIDLEGEIDYDEAINLQPGVKLGEHVAVEVPVGEFGRNAIQAARQVLVQRVREAERGNVVQEYSGRKGTILSGSVSQVDRGSVIVKIGKTEGIIPPRELIFRDRFRIGDPVRALLKTVDESQSQRGPILILSRTDPDFVRRLFENEVPEIFERVVEIREIAREPGSRSKITVISNDDRVDPVGACVGMKGARVQAIVRELGGERIDIVPWSPDPKILISRALQPARVLDVVLFEGDEKRAEAIVADDQLALAVGRRGGQNVRLAQRLTGWNIEVKTVSQVDLEEGGGAPDIDLEELSRELGPKMVERLTKEGKETLQDVLRTPVEELIKIPGIAEKTAARLLGLGRQILEQRASGAPPAPDAALAAIDEGDLPEEEGSATSPAATEAESGAASAAEEETRREPPAALSEQERREADE